MHQLLHQPLHQRLLQPRHAVTRTTEPLTPLVVDACRTTSFQVFVVGLTMVISAHPQCAALAAEEAAAAHQPRRLPNIGLPRRLLRIGHPPDHPTGHPRVPPPVASPDVVVVLPRHGHPPDHHVVVLLSRHLLRIGHPPDHPTGHPRVRPIGHIGGRAIGQPRHRPRHHLRRLPRLGQRDAAMRMTEPPTPTATDVGGTTPIQAIAACMTTVTSAHPQCAALAAEEAAAAHQPRRLPNIGLPRRLLRIGHPPDHPTGHPRVRPTGRTGSRAMHRLLRQPLHQRLCQPRRLPRRRLQRQLSPQAPHQRQHRCQRLLRHHPQL